MPFEELSHTADLSLHVWAADMERLFMDSAIGMYTLAGIKLVSRPRLKRSVCISAPDAEGLLVSFLSELVYHIDNNQLGFNEFQLNIVSIDGHPNLLSGELLGARIASMEKTIKAVTFHNLHILQTSRGFELEIVFDV
jgi:SHS2 domain-containing protein